MASRNFGLMAVAAVVCLGGCTCERIGEEPAQIHDSQTASVVKHATGFEFPEKVDEFVRVDVHNFDNSGQDLSATYNKIALAAVATVYVYPRRGQGLHPHFKETFEGIVADRPGAVASEQKTVELEQRGSMHTAYYGYFEVEETGIKKVSEIYLFELDDYFVKYRITYAAGMRSDAEKAISEFMKNLTWPARS